MLASQSSPADNENQQYCWNCGNAITPEVNYCPACGVDTTVPQNDQEQPGHTPIQSQPMPSSPWYSYIFLGLMVMIFGYIGLGVGGAVVSAATTVEDIETGRMIQNFSTIAMIAGFVLSAGAVYRDTGHVSRNSKWSPTRWLWTVGSFIGGLNVLVIAAYAHLRSQKTGRSWAPWKG